MIFNNRPNIAAIALGHARAGIGHARMLEEHYGELPAPNAVAQWESTLRTYPHRDAKTQTRLLAIVARWRIALDQKKDAAQ